MRAAVAGIAGFLVAAGLLFFFCSRRSPETATHTAPETATQAGIAAAEETRGSMLIDEDAPGRDPHGAEPVRVVSPRNLTGSSDSPPEPRLGDLVEEWRRSYLYTVVDGDSPPEWWTPVGDTSNDILIELGNPRGIVRLEGAKALPPEDQARAEALAFELADRDVVEHKYRSYGIEQGWWETFSTGAEARSAKAINGGSLYYDGHTYHLVSMKDLENTDEFLALPESAEIRMELFQLGVTGGLVQISDSEGR